MRHLGKIGLCLWVALPAASLWAQSADASLSGGVGIFTNKNLGELGATGLGQTLSLQNGVRISVRLGLNTGRFFGHEFGYGYNHTNLVIANTGKQGMGIHQGFYDFMLFPVPEGSPVRPFVCGGVGFASFFPPGSSAFSGNGITKFGLNYGAGLKWKMTPIYGFRLDVRDYITGKPFGESLGVVNTHGLLHNIETSVGFAIFF
jgi:hypothetical protein